MTTPRLQAPFAASLKYPQNPTALAFDLLTLPFQVSNILTGIPPVVIPDFGPAVAPTPAPPPNGQQADGISGTFGVVGEQPLPTLTPLSIIIGTAKFATATITWNGTVTNTGNTPISGASARLRAVNSQQNITIRENTFSIPPLAPGASAPITVSVGITQLDPPGDFNAILSIEQLGAILGQLQSLKLGSIEAVTGISITGAFGI